MYHIKLFEEYNKQTRSNELTIEQAVDLYLKNCNDWDLNGPLIYRGSWTAPLFFHGHAGSDDHEKRKSANTNNIYTSLFEIANNWGNVPKRSESYIMSSKAYIAEGFGDDETGPHVMIPYNGIEIAVCTKASDMWWVNIDEVGEDYTIELLSAELHDFFLSNIEDVNLVKPIEFSKNRKKYSKEINTETVQEYCNAIDKIPKEDLNLKFTYHNSEYRCVKKWINDYPNMNFLDYMKMILDFNKNDFTIVNNQSDYGKYEESEVWSDGEFIGISESEFEDFRLACTTPINI
jgi:hypothetical protein